MEKDELLFDSKTDPIPEIRRDLSLIPVSQDGNSYLYVHDNMGYVPENLALNAQVQTLLSLLDGRKSVADLDPYLDEEVTSDHLLDFIRYLDEHRLLHSTYLRAYSNKREAEYESSEVHESVTAGSSYPADPRALREMLEEAFEKHDASARNGTSPSGGESSPDDSEPVRALYAPHIDPRVSLDVYAGAFSHLAQRRPERVVILATSHYAGIHAELYQNHPFILVNKDFEMPNGRVPADREAIERLEKRADEAGLSLHDRAHRMEHSIELHLIFLNHLWDHDFEIVPVLVNDFEELYYMEDGHLAGSVTSFSRLLRKEFGSDRETLFLVSGDLAHIGKKFGDSEPAESMFDDIRSFDARFLDHAVENRREEMLAHMKEEYDPYRICGFPPLYTLLNAFPDLRGELLNYEIWDERERESAVSFASVVYR